MTLCPLLKEEAPPRPTGRRKGYSEIPVAGPVASQETWAVHQPPFDLAALTLAQRAFCAAMILARPAALSFPFFLGAAVVRAFPTDAAFLAGALAEL